MLLSLAGIREVIIFRFFNIKNRNKNFVLGTSVLSACKKSNGRIMICKNYD